jgi:hypothetical protein
MALLFFSFLSYKSLRPSLALARQGKCAVFAVQSLKSIYAELEIRENSSQIRVIRG